MKNTTKISAILITLCCLPGYRIVELRCFEERNLQAHGDYAMRIEMNLSINNKLEYMVLVNIEVLECRIKILFERRLCYAY